MIKKPWAEAKPENYFWLHQGPALKNLPELKEALGTMTEEQFVHHVNPGKNDFAKWVREVLGDKGTAKRLARIKTRRGAWQYLEREFNRVSY